MYTCPRVVWQGLGFAEQIGGKLTRRCASATPVAPQFKSNERRLTLRRTGRWYRII